MRIRAISLALLSCFWLSGCGNEDNDIESDLGIDRSGLNFVAQFAPGDSVIPFPSNLLFTGTSDLTLNIPVEDENDASDPKVAMNALDGFSTIAPITTTFSRAIDATTLTSATVHLFEVTLSGPASAVTGVVRKLTYGSEYVAALSSVDSSDRTLAILPLVPLKPKTHYMAALTTGIQSQDGVLVTGEVSYQLTQRLDPLTVGGVSQVSILSDADAIALEPLRQLVNYQEAALATQGISSSSVVLSWSFSTQSIGDVLTQVRTDATGVAVINPTSIGDTAALLGAGPGLANVYVGSLTLPYYLTNKDSSPLDPLSKQWQGAGETHLTQYNVSPVKTSDETVPLLLSIPKTGSAPWPIVIFQHGITSDRTAMLAAADALAGAGYAAVAIDLPLHGLPVSHALYSGFERTFDLDLVNNSTGAAGSDLIYDTSGTHYINLKNLLVTRDNVRQSVADLFALHESIVGMDYDGGGADFDTTNIYFLGHSLGGMVATPFLALEPNIKEAVMGMPGGGIAKLLDGSAEFGPVIAAGLGAVGVVKGSSDYEAFMGAAQTVIDAGDPNNYAVDAVAGRGVMLFEVTGDTVIPNNVFADAPAGTAPAPLSGTDPLRALMGMTQHSSSAAISAGDDVYLRFSAGGHRSLLDPTESATATSVMQTATAAFFVTGGTSVSVSDVSVVE